ncbi:hypothetical protein N0V93_009121 [Gnomoniopsis smithogilvyi]|uniref:MFS transporter n=1 Tax=Gnomoniopsis smithogilvyi TaxID=1191159 RepID=A0A9W8YK99_9PEZI|nr:hypothetical protein N0V93_009121 [Gnomoniopsis smithogilvyi]
MTSQDKRGAKDEKSAERESSDEDGGSLGAPKWSFGVLNDKQTVEVPGSVLLLSNHKNEPLGLRNAPARTSHSSLPVGVVPERPKPAVEQGDGKKKTADEKIILEPQPEDSANDPLNWPTWRRDAALLSLGLYCMLGGGMTPVLAAGFSNVASDFGVPTARVSLTTGLYMMGMGVGSVFASPTAILWGKRPVYLFCAILFIGTSVWCAASPSFNSLMAARVFQGVAVSSVECLPSATIAEIYFLHERPGLFKRMSSKWSHHGHVPHDGLSPEGQKANPTIDSDEAPHKELHLTAGTESETAVHKARIAGEAHHVQFSPDPAENKDRFESPPRSSLQVERNIESPNASDLTTPAPESSIRSQAPTPLKLADHHISTLPTAPPTAAADSYTPTSSRTPSHRSLRFPWNKQETDAEKQEALAQQSAYSRHWREREAKSFVQQLRPWHGRLNQDKWLKAAIRPFILFAYPSVLWSAAIYSCSVGWLIVVSESVTVIYREDYYHFNALQTGLMYISPFIGGVLGTAVAGKVSDVIVKAMARRNGGLYEPEFRLVMAIPILLTTLIGLMGYGWAAEERDQWIVPTVFLGVISFGCSLGSTTAITFCVDSYRQYAGEALVTLNFSKNIFHGLVFSFFVTGWIEADGAKIVFIWIGIMQLIVLVSTVPMFIYGKRARMWTIRKNLMEKF